MPQHARTATDPRWLDRDEQEAWRAVAMLMLALPSRLDAQLQRDSGLTTFEYMVLSFLSMSPDDTARMSELAGISSSSLSRLSNAVKRMETRGWLTRFADPDDGRVTLAQLTTAGRRVVEQAAPGHVAAVRELVIEPLTVHQLRVLADVGRRLRPGLDLPQPGGVSRGDRAGASSS
ncbi:MarR family winged helix-turn-helix transcriptional regulator [Jatrophihabitans endophyticus]|uniref:MarR family winged helix-turn-helix transcriptional regulator n=1 Tax=Jatrophihabitans endophyticus TaxID=1206085 RepID=UPI001A04F71C|nr:MarR family winged helix-turn-helix transcriptional regulator [Jatrophihabitans endophyticus]MBE7190547.1 winged helix-turn-helix transcriptional regulator [Jatrophihabitans endophyticus]